MSRTAPAGPAASTAAPADALRDALIESRQRWRDLATMAADIVFETDAAGRFTFVAPDSVLGWSAKTLLGKPAELLLADMADGVNPFRPEAALRRRRAWLKRMDGKTACLSFSAAPLLDSDGVIAGARGIGHDTTEQEDHHTQVAAALRRGELIDHILWRMRQEVLAPRMMSAALEAMVNALGAEGASVIDVVGVGAGPVVLHQAGEGAAAVMATAVSLLQASPEAAAQGTSPKDRRVLACPCQTRFGEHVGLAIWRMSGTRLWDADDRVLVSSVASLVRVVLEHEAIQREMAKQARTDPLTGLLNRRAFLEELTRHLDRLDREGAPGTLLFADLDNFKPLNDSLGHEAGDKALREVARLLRETVRPTDLVARLGGDEFAVWLNGADHLTTAERAERLRVQVPCVLDELSAGHGPRLGLSIGIATRPAGSTEDITSLMRRADAAMYDVKRNGRGHWRVSLGEAQ
ncbi:MAG: diguanylate cyclase [Acetobacteraceae bacterium]|nr:diguanylate cyclase [Acetobacteraceae bacterium]